MSATHTRLAALERRPRPVPSIAGSDPFAPLHIWASGDPATDAALRASCERDDEHTPAGYTRCAACTPAQNVVIFPDDPPSDRLLAVCSVCGVWPLVVHVMRYPEPCWCRGR